eukprot:TRINITY_DN35917_c0_g1_i1.p3 TRINITY_DN35917_c0_g1~~TRINITY_DN35917_c0_g1_i1.p3  ORF type:complete len:134 (-),score=3.04 TRINITY_DN35917_c0_g1_i1:334-735(-)
MHFAPQARCFSSSFFVLVRASDAEKQCVALILRNVAGVLGFGYAAIESLDSSEQAAVANSAPYRPCLPWPGWIVACPLDVQNYRCCCKVLTPFSSSTGADVLMLSTDCVLFCAAPQLDSVLTLMSQFPVLFYV